MVFHNSAYASDNEKNPSGVKTSILDVSVINTANLEFCYENKANAEITLLIDNIGTDTLTNLQLGWFLATDQTGIISWNGTIYPNSSQTVSLTQLNFASSGMYNVLLWVESGLSDINHQNDTVSIEARVSAPFVLNELSDTAVCSNSVLNLNLSSQYSTYQWSSGHTTPSVTVDSPGHYFVTVTDARGCSATDSIIVSQLASPISLLPDDTVLCDSTILIPAVSQRFMSYDWGFGDTVSNISISTPGQYVLNVIDTLGCPYTDTLNVSYAAPPNPTIPDQVNICEGDSALLSVSNSFSSYNWSTGATGNSISTGNSGVYYVTVTGSSGCVGFDTVQVIVNPLPQVNFMDSLMCNLKAFRLDVGYFESFIWSNGDTNQNPIIYTPGVYSVTVTDQNGCQNADTVEIENINVSVSLGGDTAICSGDGSFVILDLYDSYLWNDGNMGNTQYIGSAGIYSVTVSSNGCEATDEIEVTEILYPISEFSAYLNTPDVEFTNLSNMSTNLIWDFGDGSTSTDVNPIHSYMNNGLYDISLTVENQCGIDVYTRSIGVFPLGNEPTIRLKEFVVYPTLAHEELRIKMEDIYNDRIQLSVFDVTGKLIIYKNYLNSNDLNNQVIDVTSIASGTYFLKLETESNFIGVREFIKK